jgi:hypothetical protein
LGVSVAVLLIDVLQPPSDPHDYHRDQLLDLIGCEFDEFDATQDRLEAQPDIQLGQSG